MSVIYNENYFLFRLNLKNCFQATAFTNRLDKIKNNRRNNYGSRKRENRLDISMTPNAKRAESPTETKRPKTQTGEERKGEIGVK